MNKLKKYLFFSLKFSYFPKYKKLFLLNTLKSLRNSFNSKEIKIFYTDFLNNEIIKNEEILENYLDNEYYKSLILEPFKSTKVAINGLSLIRKDEENFLKNETNKCIVNFFKICELLITKENEELVLMNTENENSSYIKNYLEKNIEEDSNLSNF